MAGRRTIFLSYRREDEPGYAQSLYLMLEQAFGAERIFKDIEGGFQPGDDFPEELRRRIEECDVLLAVIGPDWLTSTDESGRRRLDSEADWVRSEIISALELKKRVIPVLVNGAGFPKPEDLPEPLKPLCRRQAQRLSNERFAPEARVLIATLGQMVEAAEAERADAALRAEAEAQRHAEEAVARRREETVRRAPAEDPVTLSPEAIEEAKELANWDFIKPRGRIDEHRDHLARHGGGPTDLYVRTALDELVWEATDRSSATALRAYLDEFPEGRYVRRAEANLKLRLAEDEARAEAERRALDERLAWAEASARGDRTAIRAFLQAHPKGRNAEAARKRLRELRRKPTRRLVLGGVAAAAVGGAVAWQLQPGGELWWRLVGPGERTFPGHVASVNSVAFAPDGRKALSGSSDGMLQFWDIATGASLGAHHGNSEGIYSVAWAADGRTALTGGGDGTLRLWDVATGESLRVFTGHSGRVNSVAFTADRRTALSGGSDWTLWLWDLVTGERLRTFFEHSGPVRSVALAPDRRTALSGSHDRTLRLWDVAAGQRLRIFTGHSGPIWSISFAPDGRTALSGSADATLRLWDVATGKSLRTFYGHSREVLSVAVAPDGRTAISGSADDTLRLWDLATGASLRTFAGHAGWVYSVAFAPDGRTALSGSADGTLRLWDVSRV